MTATNDSPSSTAPAPPSPPPEERDEERTPPTPARRSGPPEVPIDLVLSARRGDPASFAHMIEHWDPYLRPFVHHVLGGDGSTDRALSAAYVRAYRALPRYDASQKPGLWLHRIAYLAATDELRRITRDPARRRALADEGRAETATDAPTVHTGISIEDLFLLDRELDSTAPGTEGLPDTPAANTKIGSTPAGWRRLAPDQRALAVLVDLEGHTLTEAARTLDADVETATNRLESARRLLTHSANHAPDTASPVDLAPAASEVLSAIPVPAPDPRFWSTLGRRLLAERASPAAPAFDPMERLARSHPAEPGFHPRSDPVHGLAEQAELIRPPRNRRRLALVILAVVALAALITTAVIIGTSDRIPDGSRAASEVAATTSAAMAEGPYRRVLIDVEEHDATGRRTERTYELILGGDGSWVVSDRGTIDQTTFDAEEGLMRRVAVIGRGDKAGVYATDATGLAAGPPDPSTIEPVPLADLSAVPSVLRVAGQARMPRTTDDGRSLYVLSTNLATGVDGTDETWTIRVAADTSLPVDVTRSVGSRTVRRTQITSWTTLTEVAADTFHQPVADDARSSVEDHGFTSTDLSAVPLLGRGDAITPGWLPAGFEMAAVTVRAEAPGSAPTTGSGTNPPDVAVMSIGFQRGSERITLSTRSAGSDPTAWSSPFGPAAGQEPTERTVGDGAFNGARTTISTDARGRTHLWGISGDTVFTISGDLTPDQAHRMVASLR
ncbi:MAG: RNA polymerase sigma factor [Acidimicrobiales bacterium]